MQSEVIVETAFIIDRVLSAGAAVVVNVSSLVLRIGRLLNPRNHWFLVSWL